MNRCAKENDAAEAQRERIRQLRAEVEKIAGPGMTGTSPDCPPDIEEAFWRNVLAYERRAQEAAGESLFDRLGANGLALPEPAQLADSEVNGKLWQLIGALAKLRVFLTSTDHLSDRELYAWLWNEALREPITIDTNDIASAWHFDVIGSGSEEDLMCFLRFYAEEDERARWASELPGKKLPPREDPPFDRDRYLPQRRW